MKNQGVLLITCIWLSGCASYSPYDVTGDPKNTITLKSAFSDTAEGLGQFGNTLNSYGRTLGMITCKIKISFNISAQASRGGTYGGQVGVTETLLSAKLTADQTTSSTGLRGNVVEVTLGSVYPGTCAPVDSDEASAKNGSAEGQAGGTTSGAAETSKGGGRKPAAIVGGGRNPGGATSALPTYPTTEKGPPPLMQPFGYHGSLPGFSMSPNEVQELQKSLVGTGYVLERATVSPNGH